MNVGLGRKVQPCAHVPILTMHFASVLCIQMMHSLIVLGCSFDATFLLTVSEIA